MEKIKHLLILLTIIIINILSCSNDNYKVEVYIKGEKQYSSTNIKPPEISVTKTYKDNRDAYNKVNVYILSGENNDLKASNALNEIKSVLDKYGFILMETKLLNVNDFNTELSDNSNGVKEKKKSKKSSRSRGKSKSKKKKSEYINDPDIILFVSKIDDRNKFELVGKGTYSPLYKYIENGKEIGELEPKQIDNRVRSNGSMKPITDKVSLSFKEQVFDKERVDTLNLSIKVVDFLNKEVVFDFNNIYIHPEKLKRIGNKVNIQNLFGKWEYDDKSEQFVNVEIDQSIEIDKSKSETNDGQINNVNSIYISGNSQLINNAFEDFITSFKTYK